MTVRALTWGVVVMALVLGTLGRTAAFAAGAASDVFKKPLTETSKPALLESIAVLTASPLTVGNFKQTRNIKKLNRDFVSTGAFAISRDEGIVWDTQKPFPSVLWVGDNAIVQWDVARNTKKTMAAKDNPVFAEFSGTIQAVFSGKFDELSRNFDIFFESSRKGFCVGLVPKEKAVARVIASIVLEGRTELEKVSIVDGEQNLVTYEFTEQARFGGLDAVEGAFKDVAQKFKNMKK